MISFEAARAHVLERCHPLAPRALALDEDGYPLRLYIPRQDVDMTKLARSRQVTQCPHKGEASYFSAGGVESLAWSYELPFANVAAIRGHLSFYPDRTRIEETPG